MSSWPEIELPGRGEMARPALARAETSGFRPIGSGGGRCIYREPRRVVARIEEGGPWRGGGQVLSNPN